MKFKKIKMCDKRWNWYCLKLKRIFVLTFLLMIWLCPLPPAFFLFCSILRWFQSSSTFLDRALTPLPNCVIHHKLPSTWASATYGSFPINKILTELGGPFGILAQRLYSWILITSLRSLPRKNCCYWEINWNVSFVI